MLTPAPSFLRRWCVLSATLILAVAAAAQSADRNYSPAEDTTEGLVKYKAAMDAKNYPDAFSILDGLAQKVPADSYDAALIAQYRLQIYLQQGEFSKAIEPMERSLQLSEAKSPTYFDERQTRELFFFLVQLYFQEANNQTRNSTLATTYLDKAEKAMQRWLTLSPQTTVDAQILYTQLLLTRGMANPDKPDLAFIKRALEQVDIGLLLSTRPRDTLYVLKLVCLQQLDRTTDAAELLELLVKQKPDSTTYWQQLAGLYLSAGKEIRAITAIERAQANGFMNAPKDNFNLVGIYFNIQQYEKAAELLESGLKSGGIDNDPKNWELLALSLQQLERPLKAVNALKDGTKAFPKSGQLEFQIAQIYNSLDKPEEALPHLRAAISKGNLTKPHQAYLSLAYTAYSLKEFEIALEAARKATEYPEGVKDGENMVKALNDILKEREAKKKST